MTLGSDGELVGMLRDTATLLLPATRSESEAALLGLRSAPLLQGYRGRPRGDLAAALDAIEAVQRLDRRSEEHTSELQSLMRISYAVFCLKKKNNTHRTKQIRRSIIITQHKHKNHTHQQ